MSRGNKGEQRARGGVDIEEMEEKAPQCSTLQVKVKGKAIPLQAWTGPEGSRRLRLPDIKTIGT